MQLRSVYLENFRSFKKLRLNIKKNNFIILTGKNGTGKTNLLEAISFLSPGRGFRNSKLLDISTRNSSSREWNIYAKINNSNATDEIGIGFYSKKLNELNFEEKKIIRINGKKINKQSDLPKIVSLIWLVPEMDIMFRSNSSFRRKFLDRFIFNLQPEYIINVKAYEHNVKERYRLLKEPSSNNFFYEEGKDIKKDLWLKKIEEKLVNYGIKIYLDRIQFIKDFNLLPTNSKDFPKIKLYLSGDMESFFSKKKIEEVKKIYLEKIFHSRKIDSIKGSISYGPNKSDLKALFVKKNITADQCSTGEQKIILVKIIIQFCKLMRIKKGISPILLLDELIAHLDTDIKKSLFKELKSLNTQVWMTGSDKEPFYPIIKESVNFEIEELIKQ